MQPRLKEIIKKDIQPTLKEKFGYKNIFAVVGRALESSDELGVKLIEAAVGKL